MVESNRMSDRRYMYGESPINGGDTGWRFFAGDESDAYINDINNTCTCGPPTRAAKFNVATFD
jgi:hypothetical protein